MTLAFDEANSKLLDVVNIADIDAEERRRQLGRDFEADSEVGQEC